MVIRATLESGDQEQQRAECFSMRVVRCPRCRDEVTVPAKVSGRALVRCPLCMEEYLLAEALAHAPPRLVVISGNPDSGMVDDTASATALSDNGFQLAGGDFPRGVFEASSPATAAATPVRPAIRAVSRPRKKEKIGR